MKYISRLHCTAIFEAHIFFDPNLIDASQLSWMLRRLVGAGTPLIREAEQAPLMRYEYRTQVSPGSLDDHIQMIEELFDRTGIAGFCFAEFPSEQALTTRAHTWQHK